MQRTHRNRRAEKQHHFQKRRDRKYQRRGQGPGGCQKEVRKAEDDG